MGMEREMFVGRWQLHASTRDRASQVDCLQPLPFLILNTMKTAQPLSSQSGYARMQCLPKVQAFQATVQRCDRQRRRHVCVAAAGNAGGGAFGEIAKIAKKIQGALPIVGLISRLAAPEGGFSDDLAYPEFTRGIYDTATPAMRIALQDLEKHHGKAASSRYVNLMLWMVITGLGLVPGKDIVAAARRLRITQDIEVEIDRFEGARLTQRKKYDMVAPPSAPAAEKATVIVDALCTLCLGLTDKEVPQPVDAGRLIDIVTGVLPELSRESVEAVINNRNTRAPYA